MAERQNEVEKDLEKEITCHICHERYPKVLPCCHYYCKECIGQLFQKAGNGQPFPCPECSKDTTLPEGGMDSLPTAFFATSTVHSELFNKRFHEKCEICWEEKPESFCQQCDKHLCEDCAESHRKLKVSHDHDIIKKKNAECILWACEKHAKDFLKFYCHDCNVLICESCIPEEHNDHHHQLLDKAASNAMGSIVDQMQPLEAIGANLNRALKDVKATKSKVEAQGDEAIDYIKSSFDELYKIIKSREQALLAEATAMIGKKLKHLSVQEKRLVSSSVAVQAVLELSEKCLKSDDVSEFMRIHKEIMNKLKKTLTEEQEDDKSLEPVEEANIKVEVSCIQKVKELCETEAKISQNETQENDDNGPSVIDVTLARIQRASFFWCF